MEEIISANKLNWKITIKKDEEKEIIADGLSFMFPEPGQWTLTLSAIDLGGNEGYISISVNVVKGYDISLNGELPDNVKTGEKIFLPSAVASDENGIERQVIIRVEDFNGTNIELGADNSFVPNQAGIYYIIYSSTYIDEAGESHSVKIEKELFVVQNDEGKTDENGKGCSGCNSRINFSNIIFMGISCLFAAACIKRKITR